MLTTYEPKTSIREDKMKIKEIKNYNDFVREIHKIGFCLSGNNGEGIFSIEEYYGDEIESHTGDLEYDPWAWRHRTVEETKDIYYGKVFHNKSGWITEAWLPDFINVRRRGKSIDDLYSDGLISKLDVSIYSFIQDKKKASLIDLLSEFGRENKSKIVKSLIHLQMKILITMSGEMRKISKEGIPYGWPVTIYSTVEERSHLKTTEDADDQEIMISRQKICDHIKRLNPVAEEKRVNAFIKQLI